MTKEEFLAMLGTLTPEEIGNLGINNIPQNEEGDDDDDGENPDDVVDSEDNRDDSEDEDNVDDDENNEDDDGENDEDLDLDFNNITENEKKLYEKIMKLEKKEKLARKTAKIEASGLPDVHKKTLLTMAQHNIPMDVISQTIEELKSSASIQVKNGLKSSKFSGVHRKTNTSTKSQSKEPNIGTRDWGKQLAQKNKRK